MLSVGDVLLVELNEHFLRELAPELAEEVARRQELLVPSIIRVLAVRRGESGNGHDVVVDYLNFQAEQLEAQVVLEGILGHEVRCRANLRVQAPMIRWLVPIHFLSLGHLDHGRKVVSHVVRQELRTQSRFGVFSVLKINNVGSRHAENQDSVDESMLERHDALLDVRLNLTTESG